MDITGKIIAVLPQRGGTSSRTGNEWRAGSFVIETMDQYPRKMAFDVFGSDRLAAFNIQMGEVMTVSFDIDAREYNGRWYNDIRAFRVDRNVQNVAPAAAAPAMDPFGANATPAPAAPAASSSDAAAAQMLASDPTEDLPF